ncbi:hypothetical protein [uncultured Alsobacter sp.]|uniref:hypothetical protein n=1 Tax=uncultured Alsobacter sp. TaxID=1748258 RepID=UPI0025F61D25|nr:hypothetical protein [uncultured Alsobacter sp.]
MAVSNDAVRQWIAYYQALHSAEDVLPAREHAFRDCKAFRNVGSNSVDESLAAAEHYLFARYMVSNGIVSQRQMNIMIAGYDAVKIAAQQSPQLEVLMRHNKDNPTSKASADSIAWGLKGAEEGAEDFRTQNPGASPPGWNWDAMKFGGATDKAVELAKKTY